MTPSQINRAVIAALHAALPALTTRLRWELEAHLQASLATAPRAGLAPQGPAWAAHWEVVTQPLPAAQATLASAGPVAVPSAPAAPRRDTNKHGNRLSPELVSEIWRLHDAGLSAPRIAAQTGATRSSVAYRLAMPRPQVASVAAAPSAGAAPVVAVPELDAAAFRAAWADGSLRRRDVAARFGMPVPAAEDLARRIGCGAKAIDHRSFGSQARPLEAIPAAGLEAVPASHDDAADWLTGALQREKLRPAEIEQRLAILTPAGVLRECNTRRIKLGLPPYAIAARAA